MKILFNSFKYLCIAALAGFLVTGSPSYSKGVASIDGVSDVLGFSDAAAYMAPADCKNYYPKGGPGYDCNTKDATAPCRIGSKDCTVKCTCDSEGKNCKWGQPYGTGCPGGTTGAETEAADGVATR